MVKCVATRSPSNHATHLSMTTGMLAVLLALSGTAALAAEAGQTCRTSHNLVGACFTVHGHLFSNAAGVRLAWDETGRTLAVLDRQAARQSNEIIPDNVRALLRDYGSARAGA